MKYATILFALFFAVHAPAQTEFAPVSKQEVKKALETRFQSKQDKAYWKGNFERVDFAKHAIKTAWTSEGLLVKAGGKEALLSGFSQNSFFVGENQTAIPENASLEEAVKKTSQAFAHAFASAPTGLGLFIKDAHAGFGLLLLGSAAVVGVSAYVINSNYELLKDRTELGLKACAMGRKRVTDYIIKDIAEDWNVESFRERDCKKHSELNYSLGARPDTLLERCLELQELLSCSENLPPEKALNDSSRGSRKDSFAPGDHKAQEKRSGSKASEN